tara:strand:- start:451 stop:681 length:231 start_codon:yes stop_codon:yes gene_type:complete
MKQKLHIYYDQEGDMLEFRIGKPTKGHMRNLGDDIFQRVDEKTGKVKGFTILNFKKRSKKSKPIDVDLPLDFKVTA